MKRLAAIIPAAGMSSRMGRFKPLLPLGRGTPLSLCIELFRANGVERVVVVTGNRAEDVAEAAQQAGAETVHNPSFEQGMFSSIRTGLAALDHSAEGFLILPADTPLVRPTTVARLIRAFNESDASILHPRFQGRRGHPPVIGREMVPPILAHDGSGGLRALLDANDDRAQDLDVADSGVLMDLDHPQDYAAALLRVGAAYPSEAECEQLWEIYAVPQRIRVHCRAVARVAEAVCDAVNNARLSGGHRDRGLVRGAALTHDIGKGTRDHEVVGAQRLLDHGFDAAAPIVRDHFDLAFGEDAAITEREIVFLADKLVQQDAPVALEQRYAAALARFGHEPGAARAIQGRLTRAKTLLRRFDRQLGISTEQLARDALRPPKG
jgi:putative nucleotidyltransferase with HDIG domain